ncbi:MAG: hypothetical protein ABIS50_02305 [Luteolibacter sp.]|uniref:hypothetical protein n=1 Tax=Luteolibacter sp. TaxID=1962973 RepID=UPI0032654885
MKSQQTIDKNGRPASYGIQNRIPWVEYAEDKLGRTALYAHSQAGRQRLVREIARRAIQIPHRHLAILQLDLHTA